MSAEGILSVAEKEMTEEEKEGGERNRERGEIRIEMFTLMWHR